MQAIPIWTSFWFWTDPGRWLTEPTELQGPLHRPKELLLAGLLVRRFRLDHDGWMRSTRLGVLAATPQKENGGMVTYNIATAVDADLSMDYSMIGPAIDRYTQSFDAGGTVIGDRLDTGYGLMASSSQSRPWAVPIVIMLTDGIWNFGSNPVDAAWSGRYSSRTMTYAIIFSDEADQSRMAQVAAAGGGKHDHAATGSELRDVFRSIAKDLPVLTTE